MGDEKTTKLMITHLPLMGGKLKWMVLMHDYYGKTRINTALFIHNV